MKAVMPRTVRAAAAIVCGSGHARSEIAQAYSIPPDKIHVVPYGIDHENFRRGARLDPNWARQVGIRANYVLHVGELSQRKNIPGLLRAIALLRSQGRWGSRQVVLAGPESPGMLGASEIYAAIAELELQPDVVLTGRVPPEQLPGLYAHADPLVMPSFYEGFGFPVVEAMAAGTRSRAGLAAR
jgi:glycosyltransferase involved in cell wall biosynthesis